MIIGKNLETLFSAVRDSINRLVNGKQVVGYQTVDIISASVSSLTVPAGATEAMISVDKTAAPSDPYTGVVRWSVSATTPVSAGTVTSVNTHGMVMLTTHPPLVLKGAETLTNFRAIAYAGSITTGTLLLKVTYFK